MRKYILCERYVYTLLELLNTSLDEDNEKEV